MAFALKVDEGDEHEQAANKKSHMSVPSRRASTKHSRVESKQRKDRRSNDFHFGTLRTSMLDAEPCPLLGGEADMAHPRSNVR